MHGGTLDIASEVGKGNDGDRHHAVRQVRGGARALPVPFRRHLKPRLPKERHSPDNAKETTIGGQAIIEGIVNEGT